MIDTKCVNSTGKDELANGSWGSCEVFHLSENMVMWKGRPHLGNKMPHLGLSCSLSSALGNGKGRASFRFVGVVWGLPPVRKYGNVEGSTLFREQKTPK